MTIRVPLWAFLVTVTTLAGTAIGCGRPFQPATPPGFVDLGDRYGSTEYRAATADGVVLGVRAFDNDPKGDLAFWARAVENRMREVGGYALLEKRNVKNRSDVPGVQLRFGRDEGNEPHLYFLTLFVTDDAVYVHEAGGTKGLVERHAEQIEWSVVNLAVDG